MGFPIGVDDFRKLREKGSIFVDKTLLIQEMLEDDTEAFLVTRPRRFGKTINMSMIKYFFDIQEAKENRALFEDTLIAKAKQKNGKPCMDEQGKYPVVMISLKSLRATSLDKMMSDIRFIMASLYDEHNYLLESDVLSASEKNLHRKIMSSEANASELNFSLVTLTRHLHRYYKQPVLLLLDEYDTPMHSAYSAPSPYHEDLIPFMSTFLGEAFKGNTALKQGVLTGILRVSLMNLFSGFNSVPVRTIFSKEYGQYFGFTEDEVSLLFKELGRERDEAQVKAWYNGYVFGGVTIYNPWSIMNCLSCDDELRPYWLETGRHGVLGKALVSSSDFDVFDQLQQLIAGESIEVEIDERTIFANIEDNQRALWTLMLFSGYLKATKTWMVEEERYAKLAIPNREVRSGIKQMITRWSETVGGGDSIVDKDLVRSLTNGDIRGFKDIVQRYILETISFYDFTFKTEERFYHIFLLGMMLSLKDRFIIESNKEAGLGRYDIMLIPKDKKLLGIVLELKSVDVDSAKEQRELERDVAKREDLMEAAADLALEQIKAKDYAVKFAQHDIKQFAAIGMAFWGKYVSVRQELVSSD